MTRLGYNLIKNEREETEVPTKRKRADSEISKAISNNSTVSGNNSNTTNNPQRRKLRRTKKSENLRDEWKKYHNNFIPVIPTSSSNIVNNAIMKSTNQYEITTTSTSQEYQKPKYSIKSSFDRSSYIKLDENSISSSGSEEKVEHISKKRRLFSFIQI